MYIYSMYIYIRIYIYIFIYNIIINIIILETGGTPGPELRVCLKMVCGTFQSWSKVMNHD